MKNKIKNTLAKTKGTALIIIYLALLSSSLAALEMEAHQCENSLSKNGNISTFATKQIIFKNAGSIISTYYIDASHTTTFFNNGSWNWDNQKGNKGFINLKNLSKHLQIKDPSILLRYNHKVLDHLEVSPIFKSIKNNHFPKAEIELANSDLYIHRNITLPKSLRVIMSSNYYLEHSEKYQIPTRIRYNLKSAFIQESLMCQRDLDIKFNHSLRNNSNNLTLKPQSWPSPLRPLKESIHQLLIERYLFDKTDITVFEKYKDYLVDIHLSKILKNIKRKFNNINKSRLNELVEKYNGNNEAFKGTLNYVNSISRSEEVLTTTLIDNSDYADNKNAFIITDFLDTSIVEKVVLTKDKKDFVSFYFTSKKYAKKIKIGPIDIKTLYRKKTNKPLSSCSEKIRTHLSEYERKSFIFRRSDKEHVDLDTIAYERRYRQYPLNEFVLTNNCRGTGNFEFEWPGIVKGHFHIPVKVINSIFDMTDFHTEDRMTKANYDNSLVSDFGFNIKDIAVTLWSKYKEKDYQWKSLGSFDKAAKSCNIKTIEEDLELSKSNFKEVTFKYDMGRIEYDQFPTETRKKAGYNSIKTPISYVKTPCNDEENLQKPPKHFYPPKPFFTTNSKKYWHKKTCSIVPINFFYYKDLLDYKVHLSKFEIDGVYVGSNWTSSPVDTSDHDQALLKNDKNRMPYDFKKVYTFKKVSVLKDDKSNTLSIKLGSDDLNFMIANLEISQLKSEKDNKTFVSDLRPWATDNVQGVKKLVGITPFDLGNVYTRNPASKKGTFSLFFNKNGEIQNQHSRDIGIEQWILRATNDGLILDLISHERIVPVARIIIDYKL